MTSKRETVLEELSKVGTTNDPHEVVKKDTKEALGEFVMRFNSLEYVITRIIREILNKEEKEYGDDVLEVSGMHFKQKLELLKRLLKRRDPEKKDLRNSFMSNAKMANEKRTKYMHGTWHFGLVGYPAQVHGIKEGVKNGTGIKAVKFVSTDDIWEGIGYTHNAFVTLLRINGEVDD